MDANHGVRIGDVGGSDRADARNDPGCRIKADTRAIENEGPIEAYRAARRLEGPRSDGCGKCPVESKRTGCDDVDVLTLHAHIVAGADVQVIESDVEARRSRVRRGVRIEERR